MSLIYLYNDEGTCQRSIYYIQKNFRAVNSNLHFKLANACDIAAGHWRYDAKALIIPGGADILYNRKLNGLGNQQITDYVTNGGIYIGICAGAYYASHFIEFDRLGPLEVVGTRPLKFYPGTSIGPVLAKYNYQQPIGARVAKLCTAYNRETLTYHSYYNGGGYFVDAHSHLNVKVLYEYYAIGSNKTDLITTRNLAAIVECRVAHGKAILSGVHFEWNAQDVAETLHTLPKESDLYTEIQAITSVLEDRTNVLILKNILQILQ